MAGPHLASQPQSQGISQNLPIGALIAIVWSSVALAGACVIARTLIRIIRVERLGFEDHWLFLAYLLLIINAVLQTLQAWHLYYIIKATAGLEPLSEAELLWHGNEYVKYEYCIIGLFWTILWSVKASWLALYWRLFKGLQVYQRWWKGVAVFIFASYAGCWLAILGLCHPVSAFFHFGQCVKANDLRGSIISNAYSTAVDTFTDLMLMCMPLNMLYKARFGLKQKFGLAAVFSLVTIIISVAIARAVEISRPPPNNGVLMALWTIIESTVSVIVGCLPPFTALLKDRKTRTRRNTPAYVTYDSRSTFRGGVARSNSEANSTNGRWASLARLVREQSQPKRAPDHVNYPEDSRSYLNISRQPSDTIGPADMV